MSNCVCCGKEIPEEYGHLCNKCQKDVKRAIERIDSPKPNTELSFGAGDGSYDFLVCYRRTKPLNKFQIWMYKVCFGIRARNL